MSDYGIAGSGRSRNQIKSPQSHQIDDPKAYKKKYEQAKEALRQQKRMREQLQKQVQEMQATIKRQEREIEKKEEINDVLLDRVKCLKGALAEHEKKSSFESSYQSRGNGGTSKSQSSEECSIKYHGAPAVGGYFGAIFK